MEGGSPFDVLAISGSGMSAQRARLEAIAQNIAHAQDVDRGDGTPWRRLEAVFETVLDGEQAGLVRASVAEDHRTPMNRVADPNSPDGFRTMPNVNPVFEMVDLVAASRAYEANLQVSRIFRGMVERALDLGR